MENSEIKTYKTPDGNTSIEVKLEKETVLLSQKQRVNSKRGVLCYENTWKFKQEILIRLKTDYGT